MTASAQPGACIGYVVNQCGQHGALRGGWAPLRRGACWLRMPSGHSRVSRNSASGRPSVARQKILDQPCNLIGLFDMQQMSCIRDTRQLNVRNHVPKRGVFPVRAQSRQMFGLLAQQHQHRRRDVPPAGLRIFAFEANRVHPSMPGVSQEANLPRIGSAPRLGNEACLRVGEARVTAADHQGQPFDGIVVLRDGDGFDLIQPPEQLRDRVLGEERGRPKPSKLTRQRTRSGRRPA